ncbi:MAG: multiprotein bridging factor aMBF1 [Candidatus Bathyarchaeia archaeon]
MVPNLQCDVCGRKIIGEPKRVIIEGAKMTTCSECAKLGSGFWEPEPPRAGQRPPQGGKVKTAAVEGAGTQYRKASGGAVAASSFEDVEVIQGFGQLIKQARERMGLTPEDLGKRIGEKESVIKKVEGGKIVPDVRLATKLEHALKIKLLTKTSEPKIEEAALTEKTRKELTLGEIVRLRRAEGRNLEDEGDNSSP